MNVIANKNAGQENDIYQNVMENYDENEPDLSQEECWAVISAFFEYRGIVRQQLASYDHFVDYDVHDIVEANHEVILQHVEDRNDLEAQIVNNNLVLWNMFMEFMMFYFSKWNFVSMSNIKERRIRITFSNPAVSVATHTEADGSVNRIWPHEARLRNLTYSCPVYVDVSCGTAVVPWNEATSSTFHELCDANETIPVMIRSKHCNLYEKTDYEITSLQECPYDQGGYFIINGSEKVLIAQERLADNCLFVFKTPTPSIHTHTAEIKSTNEKGDVRTVQLLLMERSGEIGITGHFIHARIPFVKKEIPIKILFFALGVTNEQDIMSRICLGVRNHELEEAVKTCFEEAFAVQSRTVALDYIGRRASPSGVGQERRIEHAKLLMQKEFLPHVGTEPGSLKRKSYYLGYMVHRLLLCAVGSRQLDDRDHLGKKRLDTAGTLLRNLFSNVYKKMVREMTEHVKKVLANKREFNITMAIKPQTVTNGLRYSMGTGNWGDQKKSMQAKSGVSQVLNRYSYSSTLSHLRRCNAPIDRDGKVTKPRQLHNTHWGFICPAETPEGQACGLMKNFSLMSYISVGESSKLLIDHINETGTLQAFSQTDDILQDICTKTKVLLNGNWIGVTRSPDDIVISLKEAKKAFCEDISIVNDVNDKELRVYCDPGRVCRPVFTVQDSTLVITHDHVRKLDLTRSERLEDDHSDYLNWDQDLVEARNKWTYAFLDMPPPPMKKRGLFERMRTTPAFTDRWTHCEIHPSMILGICASLIPFPDHNQPLVTTKVMEFLKFREMPAGQNAIVAILCYGGYNQEDSIIMNQSGIDRGLFRSFTFRNYQDSEKRMGVLAIETIEKPDPQYTIGLKHGSYHKLGEDGVIVPGIAVSGGDILIGKVTPLPPDVAMLGQRSDTQVNRDISTMLRYAEIGYVDKVLIGSNQENAKFVKVRIRSTRIPEIGDKFASRHGQKGTIGMTYRQEDMPFTREGIIPDVIINPHAIPSRMTIGHLIECLMGKLSVLTGNEGDATPFTDVTVEDLSKNLREQVAQVFIGPTYYQRLKHMVHDKVHSRARGPVNILTRQPAEGRNREGGLRFGEMERDCMISHGTALFLKERLFDVSDPFYIHICDICGLPAIAKPSKGIYECKICKNSVMVSKVQVPYACKMLFQELMSMNISPRLMLC
ncbi:8904_t:CDS:10 [Scutellospora calospora]|uniref:8904_t:CDS:1 n=1 Tax=Scutellospora calospora TaxID=85575 RepID=A0ACA9KRQ8_9GLOM|nr:8904_t:CDS:10 [Scutellospora calospora]